MTAAPANIALTPVTQPNDSVQVQGTPRVSTGHPCTIYDKQDIDEIKATIASDPDAAKAFAQLKSDCDARMAKGLNVPVPQKGPDGAWMYPGDFPPNVSPFGKVGKTNEGNSADIVSLGMMYQLSGDQKYGDFAKNMILAYADGYNNYGHPDGWTEAKLRSQNDGRLTGQFLEDGFWLNEAGFGYDLVRNLFTADQQRHVHDDLFVPIVGEFKLFADKGQDYLDSKHNRSAVCAAGTLIAGYASEDQDMVNEALYGVGGSPDKPKGIIGIHFSDECLLPDGLWIEGAPGYQVGILSCAVFNDAETLWHHGIDMYRFRGGALKRLLDSGIAIAYPDDKLDEPMLHDSGAMAMIDGRAWFNNEAGMPYEYGYRRYQDPKYIPIINNANKTFEPTVHAGAPSLFQKLPTVDAKTLYPLVNANFYDVGYGVLRVASPNGGVQLLQEYGPSAGHAHPSKLGIDVYALGEPFMQFPGVIFPYQDPLDPKWFWTTVGNCALEVDEGPQIYSGNIYKFPRGTPTPVATQVVFGPASTMGIQRAWSNTLYDGVTQDRALFLTPNYIADVFGSFSDKPHKYDLAWHFAGEMTSALKTDPFQFDANAEGYNAMVDPTHASTDEPWTATITTLTSKTAHFVAAGGTATDVYLGTGPQNPHTPTVKPTAMIIQRRDNTPNAIFGNAVDISGDAAGYVKGVSQDGSFDAGYDALKIDTQKGTDVCLVSYKPGDYKSAGLETDALQAFAQTDSGNVKALYLGGGTKLSVAGGSIKRDTQGLAYVEKTDKGYVVGNPSPSDGNVTVTVAALKGLTGVNLDDSGKETGPASATPGADGSVTLKLKGGQTVLFK